MEGNKENQSVTKLRTDHDTRNGLSISSGGPCLLDSEGYTSLGRILAMYNAPINEEHAWALCFLSVDFLREQKQMSQSQKNILTELSPKEDLIRIHKDGHISMCVVPEKVKEAMTQVALTIYKALDFGMGEDEERSLDVSLEHVLEKMASMEDTTDFENDLEEVLKDCRIYFAKNGLPLGYSSVEEFFQGICYNLVEDTLEFSKFYQIAQEAEKRLRKLKLLSGEENYKNETKEGGHPDKKGLKEVTKIWLRVIRELRRGQFKLKSTLCLMPCPREFVKTPYELLLEDIRLRKYHLRKVSDNEKRSLTSNRMNIHNVIMDYVRSKPKLSKVSDRTPKLREPERKDGCPYDELMKSVRQLQQGRVKL